MAGNITIYASAETLDLLERAQEQHPGVSVSELVRRGLRSLLAGENGGTSVADELRALADRMDRRER